MNPFTNSGRTQTAVSVNVTNIRSLSTTVAGASFKKLTRILDLKCEVNIIIDTRTSLQGVNKLFNSHNLKWRLGNFRHKGSYSLVKGIVMVYDRTRVQVDNLNIIKEGQLLSFRVKVNNSWINCVTVYGPPEGDISNFFLTTKTTLDNMDGDLGFICSDFNTTLNPNLDQYGYITDPHKKCRETINQWMINGELFDAVRHFFPNSPLFSWRTKNWEKKGRIDHLLVTPKLLEHIKDAKYVFHEHSITDHASLIFTIDIEEADMGPGVFRANPNLLNCPNYKVLLDNAIRFTIMEAIKDKTTETYMDIAKNFSKKVRIQEEIVGLELLRHNLDWKVGERISFLESELETLAEAETTNEDILKMDLNMELDELIEITLCEMRNHTKLFEKERKKELERHKEDIEQRLRDFQEQVDSNEEDAQLAELEMEKFNEARLQEQAVFYKNHTLLNDCRITKEFIRLEARKQGYCNIVKLVIPDEEHPDNPPEIITDPPKIRTHMTKHYQKIFKKQHLNRSQDCLKDFLMEGDDPAPYEEFLGRRIPEHLKKEIEGLLSKTELEEALHKDMKPNSAPGVDGFTVKFLRLFWPSLKDLITQGINLMKKKGKLTITLRTALMKLLQKGDKDPTNPNNYRPISLLSAIYKLASCAISNRIKKTLRYIIGKQQKAYTSSDNIGTCLLNILSTMLHCNKKMKDCLLLLIDFRKAFDSIDHDYIYKVMDALNFGEDMVAWMRLFLTERIAHLLMGGHLTLKILLEQGVPQGDIISPFIFIIAVEILLIKITRSRHIKGIKLETEEEIRAQTFADDTSLLIERCEASLKGCVNFINSFSKISGLHANLDKTRVVPFGSNFNTKDKLCPNLPLKWESSFTLLGINIDNKLMEIDLNFDRIHTKTKSLINDWRSRNLPIQGRINISKCMLVSQYTYVASILPLSAEQTEKAQDAINDYIMNIGTANRKWISKDKIYAPINKGGLNCINLTDFFHSIRINWMHRYICQNYDDFWTSILDQFLNVDKNTRRNILKWGPEEFNRPIEKCNNRFIKPLLVSMKLLYIKFITPPEFGDNRFIFQPVFRNRNLMRIAKGKRVTLLQEDFGVSRKATLSVYECFRSATFKSHSELSEIIPINEGAYLLLKRIILANYSKSGKYPPPLVNKHVPDWNFEDIVKLFASRQKGSKKFRKILQSSPLITNHVTSWQKALNDASITEDEVRDAHKFATSKTLLPEFHDRKFRLLCRKTQFRNQLSKHIHTVSAFCEHCLNVMNLEVKERLVHTLWDCPKITDLYEDVLKFLKLDHLTQLPLTAQQVILYDNFASARTVINTVWLILICIILNHKDQNIPINFNLTCERIKREIRDTTRAHPMSNLAMECKNLSLREFLASHEAKGIHWTSHKTSAKIQY